MRGMGELGSMMDKLPMMGRSIRQMEPARTEAKKAVYRMEALTQ
jgi:signal recognition particle subunit SRP54